MKYLQFGVLLLSLGGTFFAVRVESSQCYSSLTCPGASDPENYIFCCYEDDPSENRCCTDVSLSERKMYLATTIGFVLLALIVTSCCCCFGTCCYCLMRRKRNRGAVLQPPAPTQQPLNPAPPSGQLPGYPKYPETSPPSGAATGYPAQSAYPVYPPGYVHPQSTVPPGYPPNPQLDYSSNPLPSGPPPQAYSSAQPSTTGYSMDPPPSYSEYPAQPAFNPYLEPK